MAAIERVFICSGDAVYNTIAADMQWLWEKSRSDFLRFFQASPIVGEDPSGRRDRWEQLNPDDSFPLDKSETVRPNIEVAVDRIRRKDKGL